MMPPLRLSIAMALALAACSEGFGSNPRGSLAGEPGLLLDVRQYYETRATEENGRCRSPLLDGVLSSRVLANDPQRLVVQVRYLYRDHTAELRGACRGFGRRTFTVARAANGFVVVDMTGGQHPAGLRLRLAP